MAAIEKFPATGRISSHGDYILLGYSDEDLNLNIGPLASFARKVDIEAFRMEREDAAYDVATNLRSGGSIIFALREGEAVGYSSQRVLYPMLEGSRKSIMLTTTRAFLSEHQAHGIAPATLRMAFNMHRAPEIIAGFTGMAPVVAAYYDAGIINGSEFIGETEDPLERLDRERERVKLYPVYRPYSESELMQEALDYVVSHSKYRNHPLVRDIGLMKGLFDKDSSALYDPTKASPRVDRLCTILKDEFDCDPSEGDAIAIMGIKQGWVGFVD